jgi:hypothetical protein
MPLRRSLCIFAKVFVLNPCHAILHVALEEKTVLNDYATTTKIVHNDSFSVVFQSLWTVLVVVT